jgi:protein-disulfide isomerase
MFKLTVPVSAADHLIGPPDASITVVEYGDFECPNCKQAAPAVKLLLRRFEGRVRFSYRHLPLVEVHPHAMRAAELSESAASQGRFWPMHDLLFENQQRLELAALLSYAARLRLDVARCSMELRDRSYLQRVHEDLESGKASGVRSTPAFFVADVGVDVSFGLQRLFDAVEARLAPGLDRPPGR